LQAEQATLADFEERIHRLDKALEKPAGGGKQLKHRSPRD
jgi:hypothetical protein